MREHYHPHPRSFELEGGNRMQLISFCYLVVDGIHHVILYILHIVCEL